MCSFVRKGNNGKINLKTGKIFLCLSIPDFLFPEREREKERSREKEEKKREKLNSKNEKPEESKSSSGFLYKCTVAEC